MSQPNSILKRGGYSASRDNRNKNTRTKCPFCPKELLFISYGPHIFKHHSDELFRQDTDYSKTNRKTLTKKQYEIQPLPLDFGSDAECFGCLGCQSVFQKYKTCENHFKEKKAVCRELHRENLQKLRDTYPLDLTAPPKPSLKNKFKLETFIDDLLERLREAEKKLGLEPFDYEDKYGEFFDDWGMDLREKTLSQNWMSNQEQEDEEKPPEPKVTPLDEKEGDLLPLYNEKPMTQLEVMKKTLSQKDIEQLSTNFVTGEKVKIPELEMFKNSANQTSTQTVTKAKRKVKQVTSEVQPEVSLSTQQSEKKKSLDEQLAELQRLNNMTPWERFLQANPGLNPQELISQATQMGIRPDSNSKLNIVSATKRPIKQ